MRGHRSPLPCNSPPIRKGCKGRMVREVLSCGCSSIVARRSFRALGLGLHKRNSRRSTFTGSSLRAAWLTAERTPYKVATCRAWFDSTAGSRLAAMRARKHSTITETV